MPVLEEFHQQYGDRVARASGVDFNDVHPRERAGAGRAHRRDLPSIADPGGDLMTEDAFAHRSARAAGVRLRRRRRRGRRAGLRRRRLARRGRGPGRRAPRDHAVKRTSPAGSDPVVEAASTITVHELTRFMPPEDSDPRRGAVLMVFADREGAPEAARRPRPPRRAAAHRARPPHAVPPGPGVLPGRRARRRRDPRAGGAARGVRGDRPRPRRGRGLRRAARAVAAAEQLRGHPDPGLLAPPGRRTHREPRRGARDPPRRDRRPARPGQPDQRPAPERLDGSGLPDRARARRDPVGLHGRDHRPAVLLPRLGRGLGPGAGA